MNKGFSWNMFECTFALCLIAVWINILVVSLTVVFIFTIWKIITSVLRFEYSFLFNIFLRNATLFVIKRFHRIISFLFLKELFTSRIFHFFTSLTTTALFIFHCAFKHLLKCHFVLRQCYIILGVNTTLNMLCVILSSFFINSWFLIFRCKMCRVTFKPTGVIIYCLKLISAIFSWF